MSDWPRGEERWGSDFAITPFSPLSVGAGILEIINVAGAPSSRAWPAANRAILIPFRLPKTTTVYKITVGCGATGGGNFDVGIYDMNGNRIVSGGATGRSANSAVTVDITDTTLGIGMYYMAMSADGTNTYAAWAPTSSHLKLAGVLQAATAYTLPATVTLATVASNFLPAFQMRLRSY